MSDQPNVLWIMPDQHNAKCTSWGRFPTDVYTSNLERLTDTGTRFERAFAQSPICTPSRTSFLTGQYPQNHGCYANGGTAPDHLSTVFDAVTQLGYRTGAFGKIHTPTGLIEDDVDRMEATNTHPSKSNRATTYEEVLAERGVLDDRDDVQIHEWVEREGPGIRQPLDARASRLDFESQPEYWAAEQARQFIERTDDQPFFAWLSLPRPHPAYVPAEQFWDRYPEDELELPPSADEDLSDKQPALREMRERIEDMFAVFDPQTYEGLRLRTLRGYLGCISQVDAVVGQMLDFLEAAGLREDTIVVYCSDHGDFAVEHGMLGKVPGVSYDAISRIPFIWSWPGSIEAGAVCEELVESVDFFPTLLGLLADDPVPSADGYDLTGYLEGEESDPLREYVVTETPDAKSVRTRDEKLTVHAENGADAYRYEFYDIAEDPWEMENRADDPACADALDRHRRLLTEFLSVQRRAWTCRGRDAPPIEADAVEYGDRRLSPNQLE